MASFDIAAMSPRGCYLTFDAASQGTLFTHWSETPVEGALAFFAPRKNVPAFKFKQKGGRSELIREMSGGTGERIKRYYSGWCQFVKLAKQFEAAFIMNAFDVLPMVEIALIDGSKASDNIVVVSAGQPIESLATAAAVGCVPHPNPCFTATTFSKEFFISTGNKSGVALPL
mmetsp:Transcript_25250/g.75790  ORF Transcript_25250/g.75790 Transcript_25250/m.75790 type:complete len:172 (-) Transcript_25250:146-661(-)